MRSKDYEYFMNLRGKKHEKQNVGFAFLLLGLIFAVPADSTIWWVGVILGIIGLIMVATNTRGDN